MDNDYQEIDHSAMATQQVKFFEELEKTSWRAKFERFCEENPWDLECRMYDRLSISSPRWELFFIQ